MNGGNVTEPRAAGQERGCVEGALCRDERRFQSSAAEEPSAESEERFQELADAMVQIVWIADASGALEYGNQRAYEYAGVRPGDLDGWKWTAQVHPDDLAGQVDPRNQRADPGDLGLWPSCERVLVVDPGPGDADRHLARRQLVPAQVPDATVHPIAVPLGDVGAKSLRDRGHSRIVARGRGSWPALQGMPRGAIVAVVAP